MTESFGFSNFNPLSGGWIWHTTREYPARGGRPLSRQFLHGAPGPVRTGYSCALRATADRQKAAEPRAGGLAGRLQQAGLWDCRPGLQEGRQLQGLQMGGGQDRAIMMILWPQENSRSRASRTIFFSLHGVITNSAVWLCFIFVMERVFLLSWPWQSYFALTYNVTLAVKIKVSKTHYCIVNVTCRTQKQSL